MFCSKCGKQLSKCEIFCTRCGTRNDIDKSASASNEESPKEPVQQNTIASNIDNGHQDYVRVNHAESDNESHLVNTDYSSNGVPQVDNRTENNTSNQPKDSEEVLNNPAPNQPVSSVAHTGIPNKNKTIIISAIAAVVIICIIAVIVLIPKGTPAGNQSSIANSEAVDDSEKASGGVSSLEVSSAEGSEGFYGVWCGASKNEDELANIFEMLDKATFSPVIENTDEWAELGSESWYMVSAGKYNSEAEANADLPRVKELFPNAYVKYTGKRRTGSVSHKDDNIDNTMEKLIVAAQTRLLTEEDLRGLTSFELSAVRNGIYAYSGYIFKSSDWNMYFVNNYEWYSPDPNVKLERMSELQTKNSAFIKQYEEKYMGGVFTFKNTGSTTLEIGNINSFFSSSSLVWNGINYPPNQIYDYRLDTAWQEGVAGNGEGEYVIVSFDNTYTLRGMEICSGYFKSQKLYYENSRPQALMLTFSDGKSVKVNLRDAFESQVITFDRPYSSYYVKITILSVYPGTEYEDTSISELRFF